MIPRPALLLAMALLLALAVPPRAAIGADAAPAKPEKPVAANPAPGKPDKPDKGNKKPALVKYFSAPAGGWKDDAKKGEFDLAIDGVAGSRVMLGVPAGYRSDTAWPLWVVLHGGPHGAPDDMASVFRAGLMARGAICAFPQEREMRMLEWNYPDEGMFLLTVIRQLAATYRIDPQRIYLAGHSMGGGGTWAMGAVLHDVFAGLGPLSGWYLSSPRPEPSLLAGMPIYIIHGDQDQAVTIENSRQAVDLLVKQGAKLQKLTETPTPATLAAVKPDVTLVFREMAGVPHDIFTPFESRGAPEIGALVAWLSAKQRAKPADIDAAAARLIEWGKGFGWKPKPGTMGEYGGK